MICKWCGAKVSAVDKKCGRCGREIPALSDCGGFYDLVPNAKAAAPATVPVAAPSAPDPEEIARRAAAKKKAEQMALIRLGVFAVVALIIVVMLIVMIVKLSGLGKRIDALETDLAKLDSQLVDHMEDASTPQDPFQDLEGAPQGKPDNKPDASRPEDIPSIGTPEPDAPKLERWSFSVAETTGNGQQFVTMDSGLRELELPAAEGRTTEDGICFEVPDSARVDLIPVEEDGVYSVSVTISGPWVENYSEFDEAVCTPEGETSDVVCQSVLDEEGAVEGVSCSMKISEELYRFFRSVVEEGSVCRLTIEQTDTDEQTFKLSLGAPEGTGAVPVPDENVQR